MKTLWDQKSKAYHNRDKSRKLWEEVAVELGLSSEMVKSKWKGLRDTFRREYHKVVKQKSGAEGGEKSGSSWPYFDSLYFLADQITPRQSSGNIQLPIESQEENSLLEDREEEPSNLSEKETPVGDDHQDDVINAPSTSTASQCKESIEEELPSKKRRQELLSSKKQSTRCNKQVSNFQNKMLELEAEKLNFFKQKRVETDEQKDYDYHFLMGLLPHLRNVKPERKLLVQSQLQQVLINEVASYSTTQPLQHSFLNNSSSAINSLGRSSQVSYTPQPAPSPAFSQSTHSSDPSPLSPFSPPPPSPYTNPPTYDTQVYTIKNSASQETGYDVVTYITNFQP